MYAIEIKIDGKIYGISIEADSYKDAVRKLQTATAIVLGKSISIEDTPELNNQNLLISWKKEIYEA